MYIQNEVKGYNSIKHVLIWESTDIAVLRHAPHYESEKPWTESFHQRIVDFPINVNPEIIYQRRKEVFLSVLGGGGNQSWNFGAQ